MLQQYVVTRHLPGSTVRSPEMFSYNTIVVGVRLSFNCLALTVFLLCPLPLTARVRAIISP